MPMSRYGGSLDNQVILTISSPDGPGIVATVTGFLADLGCNILESAQFGDVITNYFFMRVEFDLGKNASLAELQVGFAPLSRRFKMEHHMISAAVKPRILILVSKFDHCLSDLLYRHASGSLSVEIPVIVSNHESARQLADVRGIPFVHLPVSKETKREQEKQIAALIDEHEMDFIVLARYMQILSPDLVAKVAGRAINIHHSFLPGFKGARPYHRSHERGVKMIGATAHFVSEDLEEGPIISQDVLQVDHKAIPEDLIVAGRDVEARVLAHAVRMCAEQRVLLNQGETVVFS
jgi:formyltetrahydrofolate deformylase